MIPSIAVLNYFPNPIQLWLMIEVSEERVEPLSPYYQEVACKKNEKGPTV